MSRFPIGYPIEIHSAIAHIVKAWDPINSEMVIRCENCRANGRIDTDDLPDFMRKHRSCVAPADVDTRYLELAAR